MKNTMYLFLILFLSNQAFSQTKTVKWGESAFGMTFSTDHKIVYAGKTLYLNDKWNGRAFYSLRVTLSPQKNYIGVVMMGNDGSYHDFIYHIKKDEVYYSGRSSYAKYHLWKPDESIVIVPKSYEDSWMTIHSSDYSEEYKKISLYSDSLIYYPNGNVSWTDLHAIIEAEAYYNPYERGNEVGADRWEGKNWLFNLHIDLKSYEMRLELIKEVKK